MDLHDLGYDTLPPELVPWPYRAAAADAPTHCPKCGRSLLHYWWGGSEVTVGYHEVACAGWLQPLARFALGLLFFIHHWQLGIGQHDRPKRRGWHFDPLTGEPMDGRR